MTVLLVGRASGTYAWQPGDFLSGPELLANAPALRDADLYEAAVLDVYRQSASAGGDPVARNASFRALLREADRAKLLAAGDRLSGPGPFTVYRGVVGESPVDGLSWTGSIGIARYIAVQPLDVLKRPWPPDTRRHVVPRGPGCLHARINWSNMASSWDSRR